MHHVVGGGEVQPEAPGLEADEEKRRPSPAWNARTRGCALLSRRGTVEVIRPEAHATAIARSRTLSDMLDELAEHQRPVMIAEQFVGRFRECVQLLRFRSALGASIRPGWQQARRSRVIWARMSYLALRRRSVERRNVSRAPDGAMPRRGASSSLCVTSIASSVRGGQLASAPRSWFDAE